MVKTSLPKWVKTRYELLWEEFKDKEFGMDDIEKVMFWASKPVVFIGGIDQKNMAHVMEKGARNIAMIREITCAESIPKKVKHLKTKIESFREK